MRLPSRPHVAAWVLSLGLLGSCAPHAQTSKTDSVENLRKGAENSPDSEHVGHWLLGELIAPNGNAARAARAKSQLEQLGERDMVGHFALGLDASSHGQFSVVSDHYLQALKAARQSNDERAPFVAWYAAHQAIAFRHNAKDLWQRWKPFVESTLKDPRNIGWRAREELVDWWRAEAYLEAQKGSDDSAADFHGCAKKLRIAGPFGRNVASDALRVFPAELPGPWAQRWDPDPAVGESPRVLAVKRTGCSFSIDEPVGPGLYYAETYLDLPEAEEVLIAPQSTFAVWVDDQLVQRKDPREWGVWTRLGVRVKLGRGRHRVLVKVGEPQVVLRFLRPDGRPLGASVSDDPTSPYSVVPPEVVPGANVFDAFIKNGSLIDPGDDLLRFTGAFLANLEGQGDVASVMLEPLLKDPTRATGVVLDAAAGFGSSDPIFAQSQRRDLTRALRESAIKKDQKLWSSQLALALWEAEKSGMTEGVRRVAALVDTFPDVPDILTALAGMYNELGWTSENSSSVRELAKRFPDDPDALTAAVSAFDAVGENKTADALVERIKKLDRDSEIVLARALGQQDYPTVLAELKRIAARRPERKDIAERIYDVMVRAGDEKESWNKLEATIKKEPRNARARLDLADARYATGSHEALVRALIDAVQNGAPTAPLEQALDLVEGSSELEPYRLKTRPLIEEYEKSGTVLPGTAARVLDYAAFWVHADGSSRMLEHELIRVQSSEAISTMAEQQLQNGLILHMRVIKKDGTVLEPELIEGKQTVTMPHLEVGDYIETERIESNPGDGQRGLNYTGPRWFFREENIAYARSELVVISPKQKPLSIETRNDVPPPEVTENGPLVVRRWRVQNSPAAPVEPFGAPITEFLPSVQLGWGVSLNDSLRSMSDAVADMSPVDPRLVRIAQQIVEGVPESARTERAKRLYRWILANVQEGDESDGRRVVIGKNGNQWRGYITLCRALRIPVNYAVAQNRLSLPPSGPFSEAMLFTQPLLRVTADKEPIWLSFGGKYTPFAYVSAEARGMPAYVLSEDKPVAAKVPLAGAQDNVRYGGKIQLNADGSAELELEQSFFGKYAMGLRNALAEIPEEQLRDVLESRLLGPELRGLELKSYALDHFDDLDSPLVIRAKARIPAFAQRSADMLLIAPPFGPRVSQLAALPQRQTPLLMAEATHREINLRLVLPSGAVLVNDLLPATISDGDRSVQVADTAKAGELSLIRVVNLPAGRVQPKDYPRFLAFARRADDALSQSVRVKVQ
jgi:tetratricopeptide (TPR) repeat protein